MIHLHARSTVALLVAAIAWPSTGAAQQWDLSVAAAGAMHSSLGTPLTAIVPSGVLTGRGWRLTSEVGTVDHRANSTLGAALSGAALGPHLGPIRSELSGEFTSRAGQVQGDARVALRLHLATAGHGVWAGMGVARAGSRLGAVRSFGGWLHGRLGSASIRLDQVVGQGVPTSFGTTIDTIQVGGPLDTIGGVITGGDSVAYVSHQFVSSPGSPPVRIGSLSARYSSPGGRLQLSLGAAQMRGVSNAFTSSSSAVATWWVSRSFALVGGYGPPIGDGLIPIAGAAKLGVLWRPFKGMPRTLSLVEPMAVAMAHVDPVGHGEWRVRLPADRAHTVEIEGSFSGWESVSLHETGDGWWEVTLPLAPGRHELSWRRDEGSWRTLPGLPTVRDDLLGEVTVLVIAPE